MKIAVCGAPTVGKTRFVDNFIKKWTSYKRNRIDAEKDLLVPESRDDIAKLDKIHDMFVDSATFYTGKCDVIHDGCLIDSMAHIYMFFGLHKDAKDNAMQKWIALARTAIQFYDIIFYISFNNKINQENDMTEMTEAEFLYCTGLDNIYRALHNLYWAGEDAAIFPFKSKDGCPPIIEIAGNDDERIKLASLYINDDGSAYGKEESLITDFLSGKA